MPQSPPRRALVAAALALALAAAPAAGGPDALPASERALIEALIDWIGALAGAEFVRNGKAYDAAEAARFLRKKWESREDEVHSADDFVAEVASYSSTTSQPYRVRFADGRERPSAELMRERLAALREQMPKESR